MSDKIKIKGWLARNPEAPIRFYDKKPVLKEDGWFDPRNRADLQEEINELIQVKSSECKAIEVTVRIIT